MKGVRAMHHNHNRHGSRESSPGALWYQVPGTGTVPKGRSVMALETLRQTKVPI